MGVKWSPVTCHSLLRARFGSKLCRHTFFVVGYKRHTSIAIIASVAVAGVAFSPSLLLLPLFHIFCWKSQVAPVIEQLQF